jgi:hypothetical protein
VKETIYTRTLVQAAAAQGSTQALAHLLRVPENTLLRWMAGSAQMPVRAFAKLVDLLVEYEKRGGRPAGVAVGVGRQLNFRMGELDARCARCDGTAFAAAEPGAAVQYTGILLCVGCGESVRHGDLIVQLAKDAVQHSRAMSAARMKRQAALYGPGTKLRAIRDGRDAGVPPERKKVADSG